MSIIVTWMLNRYLALIGNVWNCFYGSDGPLVLAVLNLENCVAWEIKRTLCGKRRLIQVCKIRNIYSLVGKSLEDVKDVVVDTLLKYYAMLLTYLLT